MLTYEAETTGSTDRAWDLMARPARWSEWAPHLREISVLPNTFRHRRAEVDRGNAGFRADHGIPENAPLIARYTRIVPPKRIDRDLHLLAALPGFAAMTLISILPSYGARP